MTTYTTIGVLSSLLVIICLQQARADLFKLSAAGYTLCIIGCNAGDSSIWISKTTPGEADDVELEIPGLATLSINFTSTVYRSISISGGALNVIGNLKIKRGISVQTYSGLGILKGATLSCGGEVDISGSFHLSPTSSFTVKELFINPTGALNVEGNLQIQISARILGSFTTTSSSNTNVGENAALTIRSYSVSIAGLLSLGAHSSFSVEGDANINGVLISSGVINVAPLASLLLSEGAKYVHTNGVLQVLGTFHSVNDLVILSGSVVLDAKSSFTGNMQLTGASLTATGTTLIGNVRLLSSHMLVHAGSIGDQVNIRGSFSMDSSSDLTCEIASTVDFSRLNISGEFNVAGSLIINLLDGFVPAVGNSFDFFTAHTVTGTFATIKNGGKKAVKGVVDFTRGSASYVFSFLGAAVNDRGTTSFLITAIFSLLLML